jgi:hypothetical protein
VFSTRKGGKADRFNIDGASVIEEYLLFFSRMEWEETGIKWLPFGRKFENLSFVFRSETSVDEDLFLQRSFSGLVLSAIEAFVFNSFLIFSLQKIYNIFIFEPNISNSLRVRKCQLKYE